MGVDCVCVFTSLVDVVVFVECKVMCLSYLLFAHLVME